MEFPMMNPPSNSPSLPTYIVLHNMTTDMIFMNLFKSLGCCYKCNFKHKGITLNNIITELTTNDSSYDLTNAPYPSGTTHAASDMYSLLNQFVQDEGYDYKETAL